MCNDSALGFYLGMYPADTTHVTPSTGHDSAVGLYLGMSNYKLHVHISPTGIPTMPAPLLKDQI